MSRHEARTQLLRTMALLLGCLLPRSTQLPDGVRPDVFGFSINKGLLFIGESKDSEGPGDRAVQARLSNYVRWLAAQMQRGRPSLFIICFGRVREARRWLDVTLTLASEVSLEFSETGVERLDRETVILWFLVGRF
jgi:hypothetical protein